MLQMMIVTSKYGNAKRVKNYTLRTYEVEHRKPQHTMVEFSQMPSETANVNNMLFRIRCC